jgi:isopenicillin N synthase-like dioxygenase
VAFGTPTVRYTQQPGNLAGEYVELAEIDISSLIPDPAATSTAARTAVNHAFQGFQETGFIVITGHGLSPEAIARQFDLGNTYLSVNEEVKHQFHANISEGSWAGYKVSSSSLYFAFQ